MSDSYKNYSTNSKTLSNLEKKNIKKRHEERRDWREAQEKLEREEFLRLRKLEEYMRDKGEIEE